MLRVSVLRSILDDGAVLRWNKTKGFITLRTYAGTERRNNATSGTPEVVPFCEFLKQRDDEAKRSILIDLKDFKLCGRVISVCEGFGTVRNVYYWKNRNAALIEMSSASSIVELYKCVGSYALLNLASPFIEIKVRNVRDGPINFDMSKIRSTEGSESEESCKNLWFSYSKERISDFNLRMRFLLKSHLETTLKCLSTNLKMYPFGGSVNGFGSSSSDLDLTLIFEVSAEKRCFYFKNKQYQLGDLREKILPVTANILKNFIFGCKDVIYISGARIPIIKFNHVYTEMQCDISMNSERGIISSDVLYSLANMNVLTAPLVIAVKKWAKSIGLSDRIPPVISNFCFTAMAIFFMQRKHTSISDPLPPLSVFKIGSTQLMLKKEQYTSAWANVKVVKETVDDVKISEEINKLLLDFFDFYANFRYDIFGIDLLSGKLIEKSTPCSFYIQNPFDVNMNVAQNVHDNELHKLKLCLQTAANIMRQNGNHPFKVFDIRNYEVISKKRQNVCASR